jgi:hypothetical protein
MIYNSYIVLHYFTLYSAFLKVYINKDAEFIYSIPSAGLVGLNRSMVEVNKYNNMVNLLNCYNTDLRWSKNVTKDNKETKGKKI